MKEARRYSLFPKALAKPLEGLLKPIYKKQGFAEHRILTQWERIVGAELAACSIPQKLTYTRGAAPQTTLHIRVQAARSLELQHMHPVILSRITTYFGYSAVHKLAYEQSATPLFSKAKSPSATSVPIADNAFTAISETCEDAEMREALSRLARWMG